MNLLVSTPRLTPRTRTRSLSGFRSTRIRQRTRPTVRLFLSLLIALCLGVQAGCRAEQPWPLWQAYGQRMIAGDGRVLDHTAGDRTTSEAQAYAMFFALVANDRAQFDKLLNWTEANLAGGTSPSIYPRGAGARTPTGDGRSSIQTPPPTPTSGLPMTSSKPAGSGVSPATNASVPSSPPASPRSRSPPSLASEPRSSPALSASTPTPTPGSSTPATFLHPSSPAWHPPSPKVPGLPSSPPSNPSSSGARPRASQWTGSPLAPLFSPPSLPPS